MNVIKNIISRYIPNYYPYDSIFHKSIEMQTAIGLTGDYLEFGVFQGKSMIQAYKCFEYFLKGTEKWKKMRFFAFDSFEGIPIPKGIDAKVKGFEGRECYCSEDEFRKNLKVSGFDMSKLVTIKGFYSNSLNGDLYQKLSIQKASIIHVDCDLYESSIQALDFCRPFITNGTVLAFDDWYLFGGHPDCGQQRAFDEWLSKNNELVSVQFHKEATFRNSFIINSKIIY